MLRHHFNLFILILYLFFIICVISNVKKVMNDNSIKVMNESFDKIMNESLLNTTNATFVNVMNETSFKEINESSFKALNPYTSYICVFLFSQYVLICQI